MPAATITLHRVEQGSDEWLELRENLYTGNGAEKLLKFSGHLKSVNGVVSAYGLAEITGFGGNFWTRRGHLLEIEAIGLYEEIMGVAVMVSPEAGFVTNSLFPTCGYSPDGLAPVALVEVKCFDVKHHMELIEGRIPLKVLAQIHFGMLITGRPFAHLVAYNPSIEDPTKAFKIITIKGKPSIRQNFRRILAPKKVAA